MSSELEDVFGSMLVGKVRCYKYNSGGPGPFDGGGGGGGEGSACSHLLVFFVYSVRRRTLVIHWLKTCRSKRC